MIHHRTNLPTQLPPLVTPPSKSLSTRPPPPLCWRQSNDDAGYYVFHEIPFGSFGCFRAGTKKRWRFDIGRPLTDDELRAHLQVQALDRKRRQEEREFDHVAAAAMADDAFAKAYPARPDHPYLVAKKIKPHHARQWAGRLVVHFERAWRLRNSSRRTASDSFGKLA
jgi:hypothetical protein